MHLSYSVFTCTKEPPPQFYFYFHLPEPASTTRALQPHRKPRLHPPCSPRAPPRLPSFLLHPPMKKKEKITGMLKLQRALWHCGKPSPPSQPLNLLVSFIVCLFFVCYFSSVHTTAQGSDRVYFDDGKNMASCVICVHSCFCPSRALAHDGLSFWH